eukprot:18543-Pelagococcus_subviridis.AAC.1
MSASSPATTSRVALNDTNPSSPSSLHAMLSTHRDGGHFEGTAAATVGVPSIVESTAATVGVPSIVESTAATDESSYSSPPWFRRSARGSNARKYPSPLPSPDAIPYVRECTTLTAALNASRSAPASASAHSFDSLACHDDTASRISVASVTAGGYCSAFTSSSAYSSGDPGTDSGTSAR